MLTCHSRALHQITNPTRVFTVNCTATLVFRPLVNLQALSNSAFQSAPGTCQYWCWTINWLRWVLSCRWGCHWCGQRCCTWEWLIGEGMVGRLITLQSVVDSCLKWAAWVSGGQRNWWLADRVFCEQLWLCYQGVVCLLHAHQNPWCRLQCCGRIQDIDVCRCWYSENSLVGKQDASYSHHSPLWQHLAPTTWMLAHRWRNWKNSTDDMEIKVQSSL